MIILMSGDNKKPLKPNQNEIDKRIKIQYKGTIKSLNSNSKWNVMKANKKRQTRKLIK